VGKLLVAALILIAGASTSAIVGAPARASPATGVSARPVPVFAYYYIWFDPAMWNRAKTDLPALGKYSSDDPDVMRQQIVWAKQAGIDGFIVSWKHTATLDRRLARLIDVAESEHFSLEVIYQGLDFSRRPLPTERVAVDFRYFARMFAGRAPFRAFAKPVIIWSGTWMYSTGDIARVTAAVRPAIMVLASEKSAAGYERVADSVDGDAYYWSSVNPDTNRGYLEKLVDFSNAIHGRGGIWIAPAAAGFDARQLGGTTVVDRQNGAVLERELATAGASAPDALGLISWNEFSENSQIEPSRNYGFRYLQVLASSLGRLTKFPTPGVGSDTTDSSSPGTGFPTGLIVAPVGLAFGGLSIWALSRRSQKGGNAHAARSLSRRENRERRRIARMRRRRRVLRVRSHSGVR
jgi:hypothetical protein